MRRGSLRMDQIGKVYGNAMRPIRHSSRSAWPWSDFDQRPIGHAPWLRGTELYEAYGRFLDRMENGTICEDDGGWADRYGAALRGKVGHIAGHDSGAYDANLGYYSEEECDAHLQKEKIREMKWDEVNRKGKEASDKMNRRWASRKAANADARFMIVSILRKEGPKTTGELVALLKAAGFASIVNVTRACNYLLKRRILKINVISVDGPKRKGNHAYQWEYLPHSPKPAPNKISVDSSGGSV